MDIKEEMQTFI